MTSTLPDTAAPGLRAAVANLPAYVAGKSAESELTAALASNESHFAPLPSVVEVVTAEAGRINRYPSMGAVDAREAIARHYGVSPKEIAAGPGSSGVLQQIITAVCDAGDEVVFAWRSFEAYPILVTVAGAAAGQRTARSRGHGRCNHGPHPPGDPLLPQQPDGCLH
jgi:histidinol-phosphate aminotransferase